MSDGQTLHRSSSTGRGSSAGPGLDEEIEGLVLSLPGVRSARAAVGPDGRLDVLEVTLGDAASRHRVSRAIQSVLLIYLDLAIDDDQIAVSTDDRPAPEWSGDGAGRSDGAGQARGQAPRDASLPPSGESGPASGATDRRRIPAGRREADTAAREPEHAAAPPAPRACRLVRYAVRGDAGPGVEVAVTVERDGERFDAAVPAEDFASLAPETFARAAADAAARALPNPGGADPSGDGRYRVGPVERVEVFGRAHLAVSVSTVSPDGETAEGIGFAGIGRDFPRAAVLAVLDAVRRLRTGSPPGDAGPERSDVSSLRPPDRLR